MVLFINLTTDKILPEEVVLKIMSHITFFVCCRCFKESWQKQDEAVDIRKGKVKHVVTEKSKSLYC